MRVGSVLAIALLVVLVGGCTSASDETSTTGRDASASMNADPFGCESAPVTERHSASPFPLSVSQNPVPPGATIDLGIGSTLSQSNGGVDADDELWSITGYGSTWQCWSGSQWVSTHLLVHDGATLAGEPGATTTVPAIGIPVPDTFSITVPQVDPGWYRIESRIVVDRPDGPPDRILGLVAIEVTESG